MTYKGTVKGGVVLLPSEAYLSDGVEVEGNTTEALPSDPPFLKQILKLSKHRDWPPDFALNHAHHAKGYPTKP